MSEKPLVYNRNMDQELGILLSCTYSSPYSERNEVNSQTLLADIVACWHRLSPQIQQALHILICGTKQ